MYYVRDAGGKEIAIYNGNSIDQWNLYGSDNVGNIKSNGDKFFYLKDHLGTIRVVLDSANAIVSANDYDAWGFSLEGRSYELLNPVDQKYQFTGKERDKESGLGINDGYDYFGARYYDSRIANWTSIDPLFEKHVQWTPYNYVLRSPLILLDPDGMQINLHTYMPADDNLSATTQYSVIGETGSDRVTRDHNKRGTEPGITTDVGLLDPVDIAAGIITGGGFIGLKVGVEAGVKLAAKILTKEATKEVVENVGKVTLKETVEYALPKLVPQLEKQFIEHSEKSIIKSLKSTEKQLAKHLKKVGDLKFKSSVEREIQTFNKQLETIKQFMKEKGINP